MKKNFIALVIVSVAVLAGANRTNAQVLSNSSSLEYQMNATKTKNSMNELDAISPRALKNFADTYKNAKDEKWMKTNNGFAVRFTSGDIRTTILYDKKGYWTGSIKSYGEEKMLHEIRHDIKSKYYDYSIIYTQEVETPDSGGLPTYIICVEDAANIKLIRICDGEMSVWKEYTKSN